MKALVFKALPWGKSGVCEVCENCNFNLEHSVYVKIPVKLSPYKDQDYWQVMEGSFKIMPEKTKLWIEGEENEI